MKSKRGLFHSETTLKVATAHLPWVARSVLHLFEIPVQTLLNSNLCPFCLFQAFVHTET